MRASKIKWPPGTPKWPMGYGKWSTSKFFGAPVNFRLNKFFDPRSSSIRKGCDRENKRKRKRRKVEKNGENSSPLKLLPNHLNGE